MSVSEMYKDIAIRTNGKLYIGIVGPVRTGKSSFIKRFMDKLILPTIEDPYIKERTRDELPQSGSGKTIMMAEPKFIPEEAINLRLEDGLNCAVRLIDCVGYMVNGAIGNIENGGERMVITPWYDHEVPISRAAEEGTRRVIRDHSTIGIIITTDGSICEIPREEYIRGEEKTISEMKDSGKPFVLLLNCKEPKSESSTSLAKELSEKYNCKCIPVNCTEMDEIEIKYILDSILTSFPIEKYCFYIPQWIEALCNNKTLKRDIYNAVYESCAEAKTLGQRFKITENLSANENISEAEVCLADAAHGIVNIKISVPGALYYETLSSESGFIIKNDKDLVEILSSLSGLKHEYERFHDAMEEVRECGYGIMMPSVEEMKLEEPQVIKQSGRYSVKLKASAPSIHLIRTNIETEVSPAIGGEKASEDMINFLIQGFDGDMSKIWDSNIFGKSLNDIAGESLTGKLKALPAETKNKLQNSLQRIVNEGSGGLICIIL